MWSGLADQRGMPTLQVFMNSATHKRSLENEWGDEELDHVKLGNLLASRPHWGEAAGYTQPNAITLSR